MFVFLNCTSNYCVNFADVLECNMTACSSNGQCIERAGAGIFCLCDVGFRRESCEEDVDDCRYEPWLNNCIDGVDPPVNFGFRKNIESPLYTTITAKCCVGIFLSDVIFSYTSVLLNDMCWCDGFCLGIIFVCC